MTSAKVTGIKPALMHYLTPQAKFEITSTSSNSLSIIDNMYRFATATLALATVAAAAPASTTSSSGETTPITIFRLKNPNAPSTSACIGLDVEGDSLFMGDCTKRMTDFPYAVWESKTLPNGYLQFITARSDYFNSPDCLTLSADLKTVSDLSDCRAYSDDDFESDYQQWVYEKSTGQIMNSVRSSTQPEGYCLQSSGTKLVVGNCQDASQAQNQKWEMDTDDVHVDIMISEEDPSLDVTADVVAGKHYKSDA